ncbi:MAG: L-lactate dehydrogenase [Lachnospiraceae bacterium]|jgi:L-lactate dehydrogenase|nr:L-lactate dehydrogenase [Lachnospiraceae bacterium]
MAINQRKVAMVGCGSSGAASCFALMQSGLFTEMVLIDSEQEKARGEAMDLSQGLTFARPMKIYAGTYDDLADAAIIIVTAAGVKRRDDTRLDLVKKNVAIFKTIIPEIVKRNTEGIMLIVANPVDILTYSALKISGWAEGRILGVGTVLDTARLRSLLSEKLNVDARNIHAYMVGEQGKGEVPIWSSATVSGIPIREFCEMRGYPDPTEYFEKVTAEVRGSGDMITRKKKAAYYGVAMAVRRVCEAIVRDEKSVLPVSSLMYGAFDIDGLALSMPAIVGKDGVECLVPLEMSEEELDELRKTSATVKAIVDDVFGEAR